MLVFFCFFFLFLGGGGLLFLEQEEIYLISIRYYTKIQESFNTKMIMKNPMD